MRLRRAHRAVRRAVLAPRGLGRDRAGPAIRVGRLSVGAARLQPGHVAADRADRERDWCLRTVRAARAGVGGGRCAGRSKRARRWLLAGVAGQRGRRRARMGTARHGRAELTRAASRPCGSPPGEHRAGRQVESLAGATRLRTDTCDDTAGAGARGDVRALARIVHAVLLRAGSGPRRGDPADRARKRRDAAHRQRSGRADPRGASRRVGRPLLQAAFLVKPDGQVGAVYRRCTSCRSANTCR